MASKSCERCGEDDPITLDWHHTDPRTKEHSVSKMWKDRGRQSILDEIAKCQCLCANCHRKVHRDLRNQQNTPL
jgi:predicted HNH restriction endonuclease